MPDLDLDKLEAVADAARQGKWHLVDADIRGYRVHGISSKDDEGDCEWIIDEMGYVDPDNTDFICTFDPPTIKALIARCRRAGAHTAQLEESNMMACETPAADCGCCGCTLARELAG